MAQWLGGPSFSSQCSHVTVLNSSQGIQSAPCPDLFGHQSCTWYTDVDVSKAFKHISKTNKHTKQLLGTVAHAEAELGQPGLFSEFQDTQGYTDIPCLKTKTQTTLKKIKIKKGTSMSHYIKFWQHRILALFMLCSC